MHQFEYVLHVGPGYINHRGGIGAVLDIYKKHLVPFHYISTYAYRKKFLEPFFFVAAFVKISWVLLFIRKIRIVHIHGAKDGSIFRKFFIFVVAKNVFRRKIVLHLHAGGFIECYERRSNVYRFMCRSLVNGSDAVIVLSENWQELIYTYFAPKQLIVIENPIEQRQFPIKKIAQERELIFLFLGAIVEKKGVFDLIKLIDEEQTSLRGRCKFLIGGHREVARLKKNINDAGIGDLAEYIGWVQNDRKEHFMELCDYFILPTHEDAMPMAILEAFSSGRPVIATTVGSIPEIVDDYKNGRLFTPGDLPALKKIVFELVYDRSNYEAMCIYARKSVSRFLPSKTVNKLEALYSGILQSCQN